MKWKHEKELKERFLCIKGNTIFIKSLSLSMVYRFGLSLYYFSRSSLGYKYLWDGYWMFWTRKPGPCNLGQIAISSGSVIRCYYEVEAEEGDR